MQIIATLHLQGELSLKRYIIPSLVGLTFGFIIGLVVSIYSDTRRRLLLERSRAEEELRMVHDGLEREVALRTQELEAALNRAEKADELKSNLITTMNHELRTPLTSISGSLRLLRDGVVGNVSADAANLIDVAWRNSERLTILINDILDIERIDAGAMQILEERLDISKLVKESIHLNAGFGKEYKVSFDEKNIATSVYVLADRSRLLQVMANLLSNAAKFSADHSHVDISVIQEGEIVAVYVSDHGIGIADEIQESIFGKFVRGDNIDARNTGGAGLGLNITKSIIENHNGTIGFDTERDVGTTFFFKLPVSE